MTDAEFEATMTCVDPKPMPKPDVSLLQHNAMFQRAVEEKGTRILAIDPGTTESGWCVLADGKVSLSGVMLNRELLRMLTMQQRNDPWGHVLAIEMIASYGMPVGREVFETVRWIGRFQQAWHSPEAVKFVYRQDVKLHLCKTPRAKDANVRAALIDLIGPQGTKKSPGPTYGVKSHAWAALGVAVTAAHQIIKTTFAAEDAAISGAIHRTSAV